MKYVVFACVILYVIAYIILHVLTKINEHKNQEFQRETNMRCEDMLSKLDATEKSIQEERAKYHNYPEHIKFQLLSGYDDIEEKIRATRDRIHAIQNSF